MSLSGTFRLSALAVRSRLSVRVPCSPQTKGRMMQAWPVGYPSPGTLALESCDVSSP